MYLTKQFSSLKSDKAQAVVIHEPSRKRHNRVSGTHAHLNA
jgi:hypothetical protein